MLTMYNARPDFESSGCVTAILPIGAVEQHGSHLPVGTDTLLAVELAKRLGERLGAYVLPPIAVSSSIEHRNARGTVYLKGETLALVVQDIAESLRFGGFTRLIVYNVHGGNWILKPTIRRMNRELAPFRTILLQWDIPERQDIFRHTANDIHAGEDETSVMKYLYPDLVGPVEALENPSFPPQPYMDYFDVTDLTPQGFWGYPEEATAEKGERAVTAMIEQAVATIAGIERFAAELQHRRKTGRDDGRDGAEKR